MSQAGGRYIIDREGAEPRRVENDSDDYHAYPKPTADQIAAADASIFSTLLCLVGFDPPVPVSVSTAKKGK